ncbi:hypothetical protein [Pseudorhodoplanes sp.]|nr:hypothetical protein [Pseudorhodoplanes sp.]
MNELYANLPAGTYVTCKDDEAAEWLVDEGQRGRCRKPRRSA